MAAAKDDPVAMTNLRIRKAAEKKSVFHTFLQCIIKDFKKNNPGKVFWKDFNQITEKLWEVRFFLSLRDLLQ